MRERKVKERKVREINVQSSLKKNGEKRPIFSDSDDFLYNLGNPPYGMQTINFHILNVT